MTFYAYNSKSYQFLLILLLSFPTRASELDVKKIGSDEKHISQLHMMFKAGYLAKNISSQKLPVHLVQDRNVWKEVFEFVGITYRCSKSLRVMYNPRALAQFGNQLAIAQGENIDIFDLTTFLKVKTLGKIKKWCGDSSSNVYSLAGLSNNTLAAGYKCDIKIWNITSGLCIKTWKASEDVVSALTVSLDKRLISGDRKGFIKLWDLNSTRCLSNIDAYRKQQLSDQEINSLFEKLIHRKIDTEDLSHAGTNITSLSIQPHNGRLLSMARICGNTIFMDAWNPRNLQQLNSDQSRIEGWGIEATLPKISVYTHKDGRAHIVVSTSQKSNKILYADKILQICQHTHQISSLAALPDDMFASGTTDKAVRIWALAPDCDYSFKKDESSSCKKCFTRCFVKISKYARFLKRYIPFAKKNN